MKRVYLDYAATTPVAPEVLEAMLPYFREAFGNASSMHAFGREARIAVLKARETVARFLGCRTREVVFTSGGTESNNTALKGIASANRERGNHIITSAVEHHSVLEPCEFLEQNGFPVTYLPVDADGLVDPDAVRKAIRKETILISIMHANNEIGTLQPVEEIGKIAKSEGIYFHIDAVQTFGHIPVGADRLHADLLSISAHKFYGPKGAGALYIREGTRISPFMHGGVQEYGRRASTLNVPGIVGLGKAAGLARDHLPEEMEFLTSLRRRLIEGVRERVRHVKLNGHPEQRLPGNVNFSFENADGELMLLDLDRKGIACSTGSACSAESSGPSYVLQAIGLPHALANGSLRFSLGRYVRGEDIDYLLDVLPDVVENTRALSPFQNEYVLD